jgi:GTP-binding protein
MKITSAEFVKSSTKTEQCPPADRPEYAFIGRSNVGKSSLINQVVNRKNLALTSQTPGKTQLINHYLINENWNLVDLPGYGYAKVSKIQRTVFGDMIQDYITKRENLHALFVLIDSRHTPQAIDLDFMQFLGEQGIPFVMVFTKVDKLKNAQKTTFVAEYQEIMSREWEELPEIFVTSATTGDGCDDISRYINQINSHSILFKK